MKKRYVSILPFLLVIIFLVVILGMQINQVSNAQRSKPTPNRDQQEALDIIQIAKENLTRYPDEPTEQALAHRYIDNNIKRATELAQALEHPKKKGTPSPPPQEADNSMTDPTGIYEEGLPKFITEDNIENTWVGYIMGQLVKVYAGAAANDPEQGVVDVAVMAKRGIKHSWNQYLTPVKSGSVRVESFDGTHLTLKTKGGDILYFDAAAQSFLNSLSDIVPTLTPLPDIGITRAPTIDPSLIPPNPYPYP